MLLGADLAFRRKLADLAPGLLRWFDGVRRELPWRRTRDPYAVWVSEIMLQQTRVETVIPYFERFLERFPTVEELAEAPLDQVLGLWSGLGYYRRARLMHQAAARIAERGSFPSRASEFAELPGIGAYTAAAIASIAFNEVIPVLDGNVERVTSRLVAYEEPPRTAAGRRRLSAVASELLDPERPGDSNQALMELGAILCKPRNPLCGDCPLAGGCVARAEGSPERYPPAAAKRPTERDLRVAVVVEREGRTLLFRRPPDDELLAGIWEVPWVPRHGRGSAVQRLGERYGGRWRLGRRRGRVRHGITYRALEITVRQGELEEEGGLAEGREEGWFRRREIDGLPTSSLLGKILGV